MSKKYLAQWLKNAGTRALKTASRTAITSIGTSATMNDVNWTIVISTFALAFILSFLISLSDYPLQNNTTDIQ